MFEFEYVFQRCHPGEWRNYCGRGEASNRDASLCSADEVGLWPVPRKSSRRRFTYQFWQRLCRERVQTTQETVVKEKRRPILRQTMAAESGDETEPLTPEQHPRRSSSDLFGRMLGGRGSQPRLQPTRGRRPQR